MSHNPYLEKCTGIGLSELHSCRILVLNTPTQVISMRSSAVNGCRRLCHEVTAFIGEIVVFGESSPLITFVN